MRPLLTPAALALALLGAAPALAAERHWTFIGGCGSADWFGKTNGVNAEGQTSCWAASSGGASGASLPTLGDEVFIRHAHPTQDLVNTFSSFNGSARTGQARRLEITGTAGRFATLAVSADTLDIARDLLLGNRGLGALTQSGGTVSPGLLQLGAGDTAAVGRYTLSGGLLHVTGFNDALGRPIPGFALVGQGGHGELLQTGGALRAAAMLVAEPFLPAGSPASSFYEATAGTAEFQELNVGRESAPAGFTAGAGRVRVAGSAQLSMNYLRLSSLGTLQLDGGTLAVQLMDLDPSRFFFSDGVLAFRGNAEFKGFDGADLPLRFGSGLGGGQPLVRLAPGAQLSLAVVELGGFGRGALELGAGAVLRSGEASAGAGQFLGSGEGRASLVGPGTRWLNSGRFQIGGQGTGLLELRDGAHLDAGENLRVRPGGVLSLTAASWSADETVVEGRLEVLQGGAVSGQGKLTLRAGSVMDVDAGLTLDGPVGVEGGAQLNNLNVLRFNGAVTLHAGALMGGDGSKVFAGSLALGDGPATVLDGPGATWLAASNVYLAEIGSPLPGGFDQYRSTGLLRLGGTLKLLPWQGFTGQAGAWIDLFDAPLAGQFDAIDTSAFALATDLQWDFSRLHSEGMVGFSVSAVPEPAGALLMLAGGACLLGLKRRFRRALRR